MKILVTFCKYRIIYTVNLELFARILFLQVAVKGIFAKLKIVDLA